MVAEGGMCGCWGHAWLPGGMHGHWGGGMHGCQGGMHGCQGRGMCGKGGACMGYDEIQSMSGRYASY